MNDLAHKILADGYVEDPKGNRVVLHSHTSKEQLAFLQRQVRALKASSTLEIGLAYGISALCIADAIKDMSNARHYVIDPYQNTASWEGLGLSNLERAGLMSIIDFREEFAQFALPRLISEGVKLDFAYVDAGKRMEDILTFVYFLGQLVSVGGLIAFDDVGFPGVRKALRYILQQDHFRLKKSFGSQPESFSRRLATAIARRIPGGSRVFAPELIVSDAQLGLSAKCVVIEKVSEPSNDWRWHPTF